VDFSPTTQLAAVTLTFDPLTLKLVHGVLVSRGSFLPSLVFVGLFVFSLGGGTGQTDRRTDRQTDGQHRYIMGSPSRKDGPIINGTVQRSLHIFVKRWRKKPDRRNGKPNLFTKLKIALASLPRIVITHFSTLFLTYFRHCVYANQTKVSACI